MNTAVIHLKILNMRIMVAVTVKRNNPTHPYCTNWEFPHGIIIGNGPSRSGLDLHKLAENAAIYGCNALYRDFSPDFLFANDRSMVLEILRADYKGNCIFHEWDSLPIEQTDLLQFYTADGAPIPLDEEYGVREEAEEFIYIPNADGHMIFVYLSPAISAQFTFIKNSYTWGAGTGINALHYALEHGGHKSIKLYGFDSFTTGSWSNIYDGTPQYDDNGRRLECKEKGIQYEPSHGREWGEHIFTLKAAYPDVEVEMMA